MDMTVRELIDQLQDINPDAIVCVPTHCTQFGYSEVEYIEVDGMEVSLTGY